MPALTIEAQIMKHHHTVVWIDHREAHILSFGMSPDSTDHDRTVIRAEHAPEKLHHRSEGTAAGHATDESRFFTAVAKALESAGEILIAGPADAKHVLAQTLERTFPQIAGRVVGVEPMDHPTESELVVRARKTFHRIDRMQPLRVKV